MHSIYDAETGLFNGTRIDCLSVDTLTQNTPPGHAAMAGNFDYMSQRVDLSTGEVVDWQPPAPPDDEWQTWSWHVDSKRWRATPTTAATARQMRTERDARLLACDWVVARAAEAGEPVPTEWRTYRQALRDVSTQAGWPDAVEWPAPP